MKTNTLEIQKILGCETLGASAPRDIEYLLTDSRSLSEAASTLFFAIATRTGDGARYIPLLYGKGVRAFVVADASAADTASMPAATFFIVGDTVAALQRLARRPEWFGGTMVAIGGSRGKTTLKEWLFQLMEPLAEIIRSPRSYNSQIGVPLSLWQIQENTDIALIEAGVSRTGEMQRLADCIRPDVTILTNIGDAHASGFADMRQKAHEKARLAAGDTVKTVILSLDAPLLREAVEEACKGKNLVGWSLTDPSAPLFITATPAKEAGLTTLTYTYRNRSVRYCGETLTAPLSSQTDIENAANALAFMLVSKISPAVIAERFSRLHKIGTRLNVTEGVNGCSVIYDSYTSDFSSLTPALDFMARRATPDQSRTLILSDLRHESQADGNIYARIARVVAESDINRFIGVGPALKRNAALFGADARFFDNTDHLLREMSTSDFSRSIILLKGAPEFGFGRILEMLEARTHETVLEVNLDAIVRNYNYFRSHVPAGTGMIAMVKASGYGAGSYEIAKTMQDSGAAYLAVAVLDEGIDLRRQGITMPIMVMNPKVVNYRAMFANALEPEIYSLRMLDDVIREAAKCGVTDYPIHIKLDTGMHRMGLEEAELPALMDTLNSQNRVVCRSVFSHLATADCPDMNDYTELQLERFRRYSDYMIQHSHTPILRHVLNSAGILRYPEHHYDMVRLGIGLYGVNTLPPEMEDKLSTVSSLRTVIIAIRDRRPGDTIGYGRHGKITRPSRIATIPIGYADGMNRHFGRGAISVKVNGKDAPTVGNICMDACMIDVTDIDCREGDPVEIFGAHADVQRLADLLDTIPYEILTSVSPRVKRVYYRE